MADSLPIAPLGDDEQRTLGWCCEALQEGEAVLKACDGYDLIDSAIKQVMGSRYSGMSSKLSSARSNRFGKIAADLTSLVTDTKPFWTYETPNPAFQKQCIINGKLSTNWYYRRQIDMRMSDAARYWAVGGTSFVHQTWDSGIEDINAAAEDPRDVLPIRPGSFESLQNALGVIIRRERPVNYVRDLYPSKAHLIRADRDAANTGSAGSATSAMFAALGQQPNPFMQALWGDSPKRTMAKVPVVDLYTLYVTDLRRNNTSNPVAIGQFGEDGKPLNNWSYIVEPGEMLYPNKRMIQFTKTALLYDSTSIYWHGMFPLSKFTLDDWPWAWLGKAPLWDLLPLQDMLDKTLRVIADLQEKLVQPDVIADKQSISRASLNTLNTRAAGQKLLSSMMGKGLQLVYPQVGSLDFAFKVFELITNEMDTLSGVRDLSQLMRLGQMPGADTIEKITESMTPSVRGRSRTMEAFIREFARMLAYNFAQFYNQKKRFMVMGPEGVTGEDVDFDPGTYIPDYVHPEDLTIDGTPTSMAQNRGPRPMMERAKFFMEQFTFHVAPGSLLSSSEITDKLLYLQLARAGLIDRWTLLEKLGIPNVGKAPNGAETVTDRLIAEQLMGMGMAATSTGRKATGQTMPKMEVKDGGTRSTVSES